MNTLYIVATPIGNLKDITYRAIEVLKESEIIVCEDTRVTLNLLKSYNIENKRLLSLNAHNEINSIKGILKLLQNNDVAYCSDQGTPCISDPGARLVEECIKNNINIIPIPGVSASTALISASGNIGKTWAMEGFLPKSSSKAKKKIEELLSYPISFVIYESPYRIIKTLEIIKDINENITVVIGRELTKKFEEIKKDTVSNILLYYKEHPEKIKGEFALIVCNPSVIKEMK